MRTFIITVALLLALSLGYLSYAHFSGGAWPTFGLPIGGEKAKIRAFVLAFFEHVKFKNTSALASFVAKEKNVSDRAHYLTKTLGIDQEKIDLTSTSIEEIELDSAQMRARVKVKLKGQDLIDYKPIEQVKIIFLYKNSDGAWLIDTENLLPS